jgi:hypothetical protein
MRILAIALLIEIISSVSLKSQTFFEFNAVPGLNFKNDNIVGQSFSGYEPRKNNIAFSSSLLLGYKLNHFNVLFGFNYHTINFKSIYYSSNLNDRIVLNHFSRNISYIEPIIAVDKKLIKSQNWGLTFTLGLAYQIQFTSNFSIFSTIILPQSANLGDYMTVKTTSLRTELNVIERLKYLPKLTYCRKIEHKWLLNIGIQYRFAGNEAIMIKEVNLNNSMFKFSHYLNSSSLGLNLGLTYLLK